MVRVAAVVIAVAVRAAKAAVVDVPEAAATVVRVWMSRLKPTTKKRTLKSPVLRV